MTSVLGEEIFSIIQNLNDTDPVKNMFERRLTQELLTRDENPTSHFVVHFVPYDLLQHTVLMVNHKKAQQWMFPGGHIDRGESLQEATSREMREELGVTNSRACKASTRHDPSCLLIDTKNPLFLSVTPIDNARQMCKEHYDIWYLIKVSVNELSIDPKEFTEYRWVTISDAEALASLPNVRKVLSLLHPVGS